MYSAQSQHTHVHVHYLPISARQTAYIHVFFCDTIAKNVLHFAQSIIGNWIQLDVVGSVSNLDQFIATGV